MTTTTLPKTQSAILVPSLSSPCILTTNHPIPSPGPNQALIRVTCAGLNPHDQKARDHGLFIGSHLPGLLSQDVVGRIVSFGPLSPSSPSSSTSDRPTYAPPPSPEHQKQFHLNDRIVYQPTFQHFHPGDAYLQAGLQQYAIADLAFAIRIPDFLSDDEAATLPTNLITPLVGIFGTLGIPAPFLLPPPPPPHPQSAAADKESSSFAGNLLIIGGGSNCGRLAVQLASRIARIRGKIIVVGGDEEELKGQFGATHVVDRHGTEEEVLGRIERIFEQGRKEGEEEEEELVYVFDAVNPPERQTLGINAMRGGGKGKLARLLPLGPVDEGKVREERRRIGYEVLDVFGSSHYAPEIAKPFWQRLGGWLEKGEIEPLGGVVVKDDVVDEKGGWGMVAGVVNEVLDGYRDGGKKVFKTHIHV